MGFAETLAETVKQTEARILVIDIELKPGTAYYWQPKVSGGWIAPHMSITKPEMICFDAKWYGDVRHTFRSVWDHGQEHMVNEAWRLLDEADIVIGYNSAGFDINHLNREIVQFGNGRPPSPFKQIDLIKTARARFRFPYNSLNEVCRDLGLDLKLEHSGFDLWLGVMAGERKAQRTMAAYNRVDVVVCEQLYDVLRPWVPNHPNLNMYRGLRVSACHACGSDALEDAGFHYTHSRAYPQFRCCQCGGYSRATHSEPTRTMHRRGSA